MLGVAHARFGDGAWPDKPLGFEFTWLGLITLADPIRETAPSAVRECHAAGIRVVMITGDYPVTACAIARQIGLQPLDNVLTGSELAQMDDVELQRRIRHTSIYARIAPEQKRAQRFRDHKGLGRLDRSEQA